MTRAWVLLVALSLASTLIALSGSGGALAGLAILALAWGKATVILNRYLRLAQAPDVARGAALVLGLFMAGVMGLALAGDRPLSARRSAAACDVHHPGGTRGPVIGSPERSAAAGCPPS